MNKYLADSQNKVLRGPVTTEKPRRCDYVHSKDHKKDYDEYITSLPTIKAEWLTDSDNGSIKVEGVDFNVKQLRSELIREDYPYRKAKYFCNECCNKDRCDDSSHYYRKECPYCLGKGQRDFEAIAVPIDKQDKYEKIAESLGPKWAKFMKECDENPIDYSDYERLAKDCWLFLTNDKLPARANIKKEAFLHEVKVMIETAVLFNQKPDKQEGKPERFKKPTDEQIVKAALLFGDGNLDDKGRLTDMVGLCLWVVDRLYENGDILIPSSKE